MIIFRILISRDLTLSLLRGAKSSLPHVIATAILVYLDLVDLLLLVDAELAGAAVNEQQEATDNGEDLEEVVLGEVLVGVVLVELGTQS